MSSCRETGWCGKIGVRTERRRSQQRKQNSQGARRETKKVSGAVREHLLSALGIGVTKVSYQNEPLTSEELKTKNQAEYLRMKLES